MSKVNAFSIQFTRKGVMCPHSTSPFALRHSQPAILKKLHSVTRRYDAAARGGGTSQRVAYPPRDNFISEQNLASCSDEKGTLQTA